MQFNFINKYFTKLVECLRELRDSNPSPVRKKILNFLYNEIEDLPLISYVTIYTIVTKCQNRKKEVSFLTMAQTISRNIIKSKLYNIVLENKNLKTYLKDKVRKDRQNLVIETRLNNQVMKNNLDVRVGEFLLGLLYETTDLIEINSPYTKPKTIILNSLFDTKIDNQGYLPSLYLKEPIKAIYVKIKGNNIVPPKDIETNFLYLLNQQFMFDVVGFSEEFVSYNVKFKNIKKEKKKYKEKYGVPTKKEEYRKFETYVNRLHKHNSVLNEIVFIKQNTPTTPYYLDGFIDSRGRFYYKGKTNPQMKKEYKKYLSFAKYPQEELVSLDASCSALQITAGLFKDNSLAKLCKVTSDEGDLYTAVAEEAYRILLYEPNLIKGIMKIKGRTINKFASLSKLKSIDRDIAKIVVLLEPYGGSDFTKAKDIRNYLEENKETKGLTDDEIYPLALLLKDSLNLAMTRLLPSFTDGISEVKRVIHTEFKKLTTPYYSYTNINGFKVVGIYKKTIDTRLNTIFGKVVLKKPTNQPNITNMMSSVVPNIIQSLDSAVLSLVVSKFREYGYPIMVNHDEFTTISRYKDFLIEAYKEAYKTTFDRDTLGDILNSLTIPTKNIEEIKNKFVKEDLDFGLLNDNIIS